MSSTATIRVPIETRDRLAEVAALRGVSIAQLVSDYATNEHVQQTFVDERRSWSKAISNPQFMKELDEWDAAPPDAFD
jgi:hypothetical protein